MKKIRLEYIAENNSEVEAIHAAFVQMFGLFGFSIDDVLGREDYSRSDIERDVEGWYEVQQGIPDIDIEKDNYVESCLSGDPNDG